MRVKLSIALLTTSLFIGCGSDSNSEDSNNNKEVHLLKPQNGTQNHLFYGEVNPQSLGSISNIRVFNAINQSSTIFSNDDTSDISYPVVSTTMSYNNSDGNYSNMYVSHLSYLSKGVAYVIDMKKESIPTAIQNSSANHLSNANYENISYLGIKQYLTAYNDDSNETVLITSSMGADNAPINFGDRNFLTVTYPSFGEPIDGYLVYNNITKKVEKCNLDISSCSEIMVAGSRDFKGDVTGDIYSAFLVDDKLYRVNKSDGSNEEISLDEKKILEGHGTTNFNHDSFYFISKDYNLFRVNLVEKKITKITKTADKRLERIHSFTNDWVIYGSDTLLLASKKDGTSSKPILLAETTQTKGYKYVTKYGVGDDFLFVTYSISDNAKTTYKACLFNGTSPKCRDNSFWAGATASKYGKINFKSNYPYTPYAYIRIDNTDNFGGGTLKAIDPKYPLEDGLKMGSVAQYNFQTFLSNSRYFDKIIDSDGGVVLYAKNDTNFHVDSFYMNLLKEKSLKQLTNTKPIGINSGQDHCHGRHCMICHNLAGGKIYGDKNGTESVYDYKIRFDFEDGTKLLADVAKGKGENFSVPLDKITKNFKANIIDENGTVQNSSTDYYHNGIESSNCNFCHARYGKTRFNAPSVITIKK